MTFMNKAFRGEGFNLATCGSRCVFLNAENYFFPMRRKKDGGGGRGEEKKKKEISIKTVTEIPTNQSEKLQAPRIE